MKTTMYGLLGMVKDGKMPKKIKYDNDIWIYDEISRDYILIDKSGEEALICGELNLMFALNDEVEILEEPKGIPEKLEILPNNEQYSNKVLYGKISF